MVGSLGLSCRYKRFLFCLGCSSWPSTKYFFPHHTLFQPPSLSQLGRQPCWVACLLVCVSGHGTPVRCSKFRSKSIANFTFLVQILCFYSAKIYIYIIQHHKVEPLRTPKGWFVLLDNRKKCVKVHLVHRRHTPWSSPYRNYIGGGLSYFVVVSKRLQLGSFRMPRGSSGRALAGLLYGRPEFKSRLGIPGSFFPLSEQALKKKERSLGECIWMNVLYGCDYECIHGRGWNSNEGVTNENFLAYCHNIRRVFLAHARNTPNKTNSWSIQKNLILIRQENNFTFVSSWGKSLWRSRDFSYNLVI